MTDRLSRKALVVVVALGLVAGFASGAEAASPRKERRQARRASLDRVRDHARGSRSQARLQHKVRMRNLGMRRRQQALRGSQARGAALAGEVETQRARAEGLRTEADGLRSEAEGLRAQIAALKASDREAYARLLEIVRTFVADPEQPWVVQIDVDVDARSVTEQTTIVEAPAAPAAPEWDEEPAYECDDDDAGRQAAADLLTPYILESASVPPEVARQALVEIGHLVDPRPTPEVTGEPEDAARLADGLPWQDATGAGMGMPRVQ